MRVTLKRNEPPRGLARVCAGPQGWEVRVDGKKVGSVNHVGRGIGNATRPTGWYFTAFDPLPYVNTCNEPVADPEEAKRAAVAYVKANWPKA